MSYTRAVAPSLERLQCKVLVDVHSSEIYMCMLCDRCHVEIYAWAGELRRWDGLHRRVTSFKVYIYPAFLRNQYACTEMHDKELFVFVSL